MSDKKIGYIVLILLFCTTVSVLGYAFWIFSFPKELRIIKIDRIGNLKIEDPVKINGVIVGEIKKINRFYSSVLLTIEASEPINIYRNYIIYAFDKGIMGDRMLTIEPGDSDFPLMGSQDTLIATFIPGISEALGKAWKLKQLIHIFKKNAELLLSGKERDVSFVFKFKKIVSSLDTYSIKLLKIASFLNNELSSGIDSLNKFTKTARQLSHNTAVKIPEKINIFEKEIDNVNNFVLKLDNLVDNLTGFVMEIETSQYMRSDQLEYINKDLREIKDMINYIRSGTVYFKQRWHLEF
jgi:phospholipid/cholesterol/gamma-HCH transport system substrate-binding protein